MKREKAGFLTGALILLAALGLLAAVVLTMPKGMQPAPPPGVQEVASVVRVDSVTWAQPVGVHEELNYPGGKWTVYWSNGMRTSSSRPMQPGDTARFITWKKK